MHHLRALEGLRRLLVILSQQYDSPTIMSQLLVKLIESTLLLSHDDVWITSLLDTIHILFDIIVQLNVRLSYYLRRLEISFQSFQLSLEIYAGSSLLNFDSILVALVCNGRLLDAVSLDVLDMVLEQLSLLLSDFLICDRRL